MSEKLEKLVEALDELTLLEAAELSKLLAELRDDGVTVLVVDQMANLALTVADRGYVLERGRVVHAGPAAALRDDPVIERAYLGSDAAD